MGKEIGPREKRMRELREKNHKERGGKEATVADLRALVAKVEKRKTKPRKGSRR